MTNRPQADVRDGYYVWKKGQDVALGTYFSGAEAQCRCKYPACVEQRMSVELIKRVDAVRYELCHPVTMTNGFRCAAHQADLFKKLPAGHTVAKSTHELGHAADLTSESLAQLRAAMVRHFKAIGTGSTFIHGDIRDDGVRRWNYD